MYSAFQLSPSKHFILPICQPQSGLEYSDPETSSFSLITMIRSAGFEVLLFASYSSMIMAVPTGTAIMYPEVHPGPGLPSLASLNLTSADPYLMEQYIGEIDALKRFSTDSKKTKLTLHFRRHFRDGKTIQHWKTIYQLLHPRTHRFTIPYCMQKLSIQTWVDGMWGSLAVAGSICAPLGRWQSGRDVSLDTQLRLTDMTLLAIPWLKVFLCTEGWRSSEVSIGVTWTIQNCKYGGAQAARRIPCLENRPALIVSL